MKTKLRLIYDATKAQERAAREVKSQTDTHTINDDEFTRNVLTANHGPHISAWLVKRFRSALKRTGYFVLRLPNDAELPMWLSLGMRFFKQRADRWIVDEFTVASGRLWKVTYLRHGRFRPGARTLRVV